MDQTAALPGPHGIVRLHRWRALRRLVLGGEVGFAEAYIAGDWSSPDLSAVIELVARNHAAFETVINGSKLARLLGQESAAIEQPRLRGKRGDLPCRRLRISTYAPGYPNPPKSSTTWTACRSPDGRWKLADAK